MNRYRAALAAVFVLSLWLRSAFGLTAAGNAAYDDLLFLRLAESIGRFDWLGPYNELTHSKGAAYPAFVWLNHLLGLPLKMTEHAAYLGGSLLFAWATGRLFASRAATLVCFLFLAFNPVMWLGEAAGRVVRDNLYLTLTLVILAAGTRIFLIDRDLDPGALAKRRWPWLVAFGVTGGIFWLTREEGLWLVPSVAVILGYWVVLKARQPVAALKVLSIPLAVFALVVGAVNAANYVAYGVFRNNDFRSADFEGAYGALSRIEHERWERMVPFPRDAREKAYAQSAAARQLQPFFEGAGAKGWIETSCHYMERTGCREILAGWFVWALRQSVAEAGHYKTAKEARAFYRQLAREVNGACDRKAIPCRASRSTLAPPWHPSYAGHTIAAAKKVYGTLVTFGGVDPNAKPSVGSAQEIEYFNRLTGSRAVTEEWTGPRGVRQNVATQLSRLQRFLVPILFPASVVLWLFLVAVSMRRRTLDPGHVLAAALFAAIAMRIGLLGFLDATSIPANTILYLSPAVPELLAFIPCVLFLAVRIGVLRPKPA